MENEKAIAEHPLFLHCLSELDLALKRFGTYSFDDKGPVEVMGLQELDLKFRELTPDEAADILVALSKCPLFEGRPESLVSSLIIDMQDWDELFETGKLDDIDW